MLYFGVVWKASESGSFLKAEDEMLIIYTFTRPIGELRNSLLHRPVIPTSDSCEANSQDGILIPCIDLDPSTCNFLSSDKLPRHQ